MLVMQQPNQPRPTHVNYQTEQPQHYSPEAIPVQRFGRGRRRIDSSSDTRFLVPFVASPYYNNYPYYQPYYPPYPSYPSYPPYPSYYPYTPYPHPYPYSPYAYTGAEQYQSAQPVMTEYPYQDNEHDELA